MLLANDLVTFSAALYCLNVSLLHDFYGIPDHGLIGTVTLLLSCSQQRLHSPHLLKYIDNMMFPDGAALLKEQINTNASALALKNKSNFFYLLILLCHTEVFPHSFILLWYIICFCFNFIIASVT